MDPPPVRDDPPLANDKEGAINPMAFSKGGGGGKISGAVGGGMKMSGGSSAKVGGIRTPFTSAVVKKGKLGGKR